MPHQGGSLDRGGELDLSPYSGQLFLEVDIAPIQPTTRGTDYGAGKHQTEQVLDSFEVVELVKVDGPGLLEAVPRVAEQVVEVPDRNQVRPNSLENLSRSCGLSNQYSRSSGST